MIVTLLVGCDESTPAELMEVEAGARAPNQVEPPLYWVDLVRGEAWSLAPPSDDPYQERRGEREVCRASDFGEEYSGVEISTVYCDYMTVTQPLLTDISAGDRLEVIVWHSPLLSDAPSSGALAITLGAAELWSTPLTIPADARSWTLTLSAPIDLVAGDPVYFHVRNHGANTYTLLSIRLGRPQSALNR